MQIESISVMLNTQYRMHEHIMNFSNHQFYGGNLQADDSVKSTILSKQADDFYLNKALSFIDTAGCGFNEITNPESLSIANPEEAVLLLKHLRLLLNQYREKIKATKDITVGIISPYKEQVQYLTQLIAADEELQLLPAKIVVKTVDGFQGQERDIVYISLVRSNDNKEIGFLNDIRRMNVALTRARERLVVIGDSATLANHPFYNAFIEYAENVDAYQSAWEFAE